MARMKFDLPINGRKMTTLDHLKENMTVEIVGLARSGQLERWLRSQRRDGLAEALATLLQQSPDDATLCLGICKLLEIEAHPDDIAAHFGSPPEAGMALKQPVSMTRTLIAGRYELSADGSEVVDHQTGLIWMKQVKTELTFDQAQVYAGQVARETGRAWRVPTIDELVSLVDPGRRHYPASGFPDMPPEDFWSSSPYMDIANLAWNVRFGAGNVSSTCRENSLAVRLVRGYQLGHWLRSQRLDALVEALATLLQQSPDDATLRQWICNLLEFEAQLDGMMPLFMPQLALKTRILTLIAGRYELSADGSEVLDHQTGLIWMKQVKTGLTFAQAKAYARQVARETGRAWRVPTVDELASLLDRSRGHGAVSGFPDMPLEDFWSSSSYASNADYAWLVNFDYGSVNSRFRGNFAVRLVRSGRGRWLWLNQQDALAQALATLLQRSPDDATLCLGICNLLQVEAHPDDIAALFRTPLEAEEALKQPVSETRTLIAGRYELSADGREVVDHQTGLIWMKHVETGLKFDEAQAYAGQVARETWLAWRVPTAEELASLVNRSCCNPASGFPDMPSNRFWSSSPYVGDAHSAWSVSFDSGNVDSYYRSGSYAVRLVRGGQPGRLPQSLRSYALANALATLLQQSPDDATLCQGICNLLQVEVHPDDIAVLLRTPLEAEGTLKQPVSETRPLIAGRYEVSADGSEVVDHQTGLIWMKQVKTELTFDEAQDYAGQVARETGLAWRVPTVDELISLVDHSCSEPASRFPDMPSDWFWSSSPYVGDSNYAWGVDFNYGFVSSGNRDGSDAVRLVRGG